MICLGSGCSEETPRRGVKYCSAECRAESYVGRKQRSRETCPCGTKFDKYKGRSRVYCSEFCSRRFDRRGDTWKNNPEMAREHASRPKPNHGLKGHKQSEKHLLSRLGSGAIRASREELSLIPVMTTLGFRHTGEGGFWRRWPDGTLHNPDFVNEDKRVVAEYFGSYWHEGDRGREGYIRNQWKAIGYDCLILWSEDREAFMAAPSVSWGAQATGGSW